MLVLSRKREQEIVMTIHGIEIRVKVLRAVGDRIRIGIEAPDCVSVRRGEIPSASNESSIV